MGFCHRWMLRRDLSTDEWALICTDLVKLASALKSRAELIRRQHHWLNRLFLGIRLKDPGFLPPRNKTSFWDANTISFGPDLSDTSRPAEIFTFQRVSHTGFVKTDACVYDHLVVATLILIRRMAREDFTMISTDGEFEHWMEIELWMDMVLKNKSAVLDALHGSIFKSSSIIEKPSTDGQERSA